MSESSGRRVVSSGREAPTLLVVYLCPECGFVCVCDAYDGPPSCFGQAEGSGGHTARFMEPQVIAEGQPAERSAG